MSMFKFITKSIYKCEMMNRDHTLGPCFWFLSTSGCQVLVGPLTPHPACPFHLLTPSLASTGRQINSDTTPSRGLPLATPILIHSSHQGAPCLSYTDHCILDTSVTVEATPVFWADTCDMNVLKILWMMVKIDENLVDQGKVVKLPLIIIN